MFLGNVIFYYSRKNSLLIIVVYIIIKKYLIKLNMLKLIWNFSVCCDVELYRIIM